MILKSNDKPSQLFKSEEGSHYYYPDGRPCHTVPYADKKRAGESKPTTLRDAKKLGLLPSVTTLLKILDRPGLNNWRCEMAVMAALTLPRKPGEADDDFARRVAADSDTIRDTAADFGTAIHDANEAYAKQWLIDRKGIVPHFESPVHPFAMNFHQWFNENIETVLSVEEVVVNLEYGYAGLRDLKAIHKKHGLVTLDWKTQGVKPGNKITFYDEWLRQLAAYDMADPNPEPTRLVSVVLNSRVPEPLQEKVWSDDEAARARESFKLICLLWQNEKQYRPGVAA